MSYTIEEVDFEETSDEEIEPILAAVNLLEKEVEPRAVALTLDELRIFARSPGMTNHRFVVTSRTGDLAGIGDGRYPDDGTNARVVRCNIGVLPQHRRNGVGSMMLAYLCDLAEEKDRDRLHGFFHDTVPAGRAFAEAIGADPGLEFHSNVVRVADLDRPLLESWASIGRERAPGYSVELFQGAVPDRLLGDVAHLIHVVERDSPMPEDFEPQEWTADRARAMQDRFLEASDALTAFAFDEGGTVVGMSQLIRRRSDPTTWFVTLTVVEPEHRGRSLGKWVKGTVNVAALEHWEGGVFQETGNAFTNDAMLAINHTMGFEHEFTMTNCSISVENARAYLDSSEVGH